MTSRNLFNAALKLSSAGFPRCAGGAKSAKALRALLADPPFHVERRGHWHNHVPQVVQREWRKLPMDARLAVFLIAVEQVVREI